MTDPKNQTTDADLLPLDDDATATEALRKKLADAQTSGYQVEFDPEEAERAGAFQEDALSEEDAIASNPDLVGVSGEEIPQPAFLDDEDPSAEIPTFITLTNAYEMFGMTEGETVEEAMARHNARKG